MTTDRVSALVLVALAALAYWWVIPTYAGVGELALLSNIAVLMVGALALLLFVMTFVTKTAGGDPDDPFMELGGGEPWRLLALMAIWAVVTLSMRQIGFYVGGGVALAASLVILGARRPLFVIACTALTLIGIYLVFEQGFILRMPRGRLWMDLEPAAPAG